MRMMIVKATGEYPMRSSGPRGKNNGDIRKRFGSRKRAAESPVSSSLLFQLQLPALCFASDFIAQGLTNPRTDGNQKVSCRRD